VLLTAVCTVAAFVILSNMLIGSFADNADKLSKDNLRQTVTLARNAIEPIVESVRSGQIDRARGLELARAQVRLMTYSDQYGPNYIFMSSYDGTMLVQPFEPEKEMTNQLDLQDYLGEHIIKRLISRAKSSEGKGFVTYHYPPPGSSQPETKKAFVIGIPELDCYIGTGMYLQQAQKDGERLLKLARSLSVALILLMLLPIMLSIRRMYQHNRELSRQIITREQAEEALRESENRFRKLFMMAPMPLCNVSLDGQLKGINQRWSQLIGYTLQDAPHLDQWWHLAYPDPEYRKHVLDAWGAAMEEAVRTDGEVEDSEYEVACKDGTVRTMLIGAKIIGGEFIASLLDISARKQAEEALRSSESKLRSLFSAMMDIILVLDSNGRYIEIAPTNAKSLYRPADELLGKTLAQVFEAEKAEQFLGVIRAALSSREPVFFDYDLDIEGRRTWFSGTVSPLSGDQVILVARDITDRKESEMERERLQTQLLQSQKMEAVGQLAGGVAHDFNNMLQAILGYVGLAQNEMDSPVRLAEDLAEIKAAAERSANLTRQLLAFARKQTVLPVVMDLDEAVEGMLKMLRRLIGEDIDLVWIPGGDPWSIMIDPAQVDQILANLCVNARDAISGVGKITIETGVVSLKTSRHTAHCEITPGEYVILVVSDSGCGMDKETCEKVFEPFFTTKGLGKGTGLGLATVYGIVSQNGGFIDVLSDSGKGTVFRIYLPRYKGESVEDKPVQVPEIPRSDGETVLLVEDETVILRMTSRMLESLGYSVLPANAPHEALAIAERYSGPIHLVLTDVIMPAMNGKDLVRHLEKVRPGIKCLFMSGYAANIVADRGVLDDNIQFIHKPFALTELSSAIRSVLDEA
jgi:PAS domain S-box-containing protein